MGKNIIVCLDGTGNEFSEEYSNIVALTRILDRSSEKQIVYYEPGVGTLPNPIYKTRVFKGISKLKRKIFGDGVLEKAKRAYQYLMDHYNKGDKIFIFGFSRGAYTARVLAGLINAFGIIHKGNNNLLHYAIQIYKQKKINFKLILN